MTVRFISSDNNILLIETIKSVRRDLTKRHLNHPVLEILRTQYNILYYVIVFIRGERALGVSENNIRLKILL